MSEEFTENIIDNVSEIAAEEPQPEPSLRPGFTSICLRIGVMMIIVFGVRMLGTVVIALLSPFFYGLNDFQMMLVSFVYSEIFLNIIPIALGIVVLKFPFKERVKSLYSKPRYLGRAVGMFPACYGGSMIMQLFTLLLAKLFSGTAVSDSFSAMDNMMSLDMPSAIVMFVQATILAPIFEELWFRGLVLESLRPYGNGFAIFVSAI